MHSITINFKDSKVYSQVKWFLGKFSSNEIEVIEKEETTKLSNEDNIIDSFLEQSENEIKSGSIHSHDFVVNEMKTKYGI